MPFKTKAQRAEYMRQYRRRYMAAPASRLIATDSRIRYQRNHPPRQFDVATIPTHKRDPFAHATPAVPELSPRAPPSVYAVPHLVVERGRQLAALEIVRMKQHQPGLREADFLDYNQRVGFPLRGTQYDGQRFRLGTRELWLALQLAARAPELQHRGRVLPAVYDSRLVRR